MRAGRLLKVALGEVGVPLWRSWPLALGVALGVACLVFLFGLSDGVAGALRERVLGSLPDRIRVEPAPLRLGPVELGDALGQPVVDKLRALPGVTAVYRQARFPEPVQLRASYGGQSFWSDVVLEGVDAGLVEDQLTRGWSFEPRPGADVPAVLPRVMVDVLSAGVAIGTSLPRVSPDLLLGRHFTLHLGLSSFAPAPAGPVETRRCAIVGISDQVGVGGPAVPLELMESWTDRPVQVYAVTLQVDEPSRVAEVAAGVQALGLRTPGLDVARQVAAGVAWVRAVLALFGGAVLLVAGVGIFTGLSLQVREEEADIGLYRAVGAARRDILALYLARAGLIGLGGSLLGAVLGLVAGFAVEGAVLRLAGESLAETVRLFRPGVASVLGSAAFGTLASLSAGLLPARSAAALHPAEALRRR